MVDALMTEVASHVIGTHCPFFHWLTWLPPLVLIQVSPFLPPVTVPELITGLASGVKWTVAPAPGGVSTEVTVNGPPNPPLFVNVSPGEIPFACSCVQPKYDPSAGVPVTANTQSYGVAALMIDRTPPAPRAEIGTGGLAVGSWAAATVALMPEPTATVPDGACETENTPGEKPDSNGPSGMVLNVIPQASGSPPIRSVYPQTTCLVVPPPRNAGSDVMSSRSPSRSPGTDAKNAAAARRWKLNSTVGKRTSSVVPRHSSCCAIVFTWPWVLALIVLDAVYPPPTPLGGAAVDMAPDVSWARAEYPS